MNQCTSWAVTFGSEVSNMSSRHRFGGVPTVELPGGTQQEWGNLHQLDASEMSRFSQQIWSMSTHAWFWLGVFNWNRLLQAVSAFLPDMLYWFAWVFWQHWTCQAPSDGPLPCEQYPMVCDQAPAELWEWWRLLFSLLWESVLLECQVWHTLPSYCSDNIRSALSTTEKISLLKDLREWTSWIHWSLTQKQKHVINW